MLALFGFYIAYWCYLGFKLIKMAFIWVLYLHWSYIASLYTSRLQKGPWHLRNLVSAGLLRTEPTVKQRHEKHVV